MFSADDISRSKQKQSCIPLRRSFAARHPASDKREAPAQATVSSIGDAAADQSNDRKRTAKSNNCNDSIDIKRMPHSNGDYLTNEKSPIQLKCNSNDIESECITRMHKQINYLLNSLKMQNDKIKHLENQLNERDYQIVELYETEIANVCRKFAVDKAKWMLMLSTRNKQLREFRQKNSAYMQWLRLYEEQCTDQQKYHLVNMMYFYQRAAEIVRLIDQLKLG